MKLEKTEKLDLFDRRILDLLAAEGRLSVSEVSRRVGLSKTPCHNRIRRLEREGYVLGYRAIIDLARLGRSHIAFVQVTLSNTSLRALEAFNGAALKIPEIEQFHMIAGGFDYLLKVRTESISDYRKVLGEKISLLPHVSHTSTFVVMEPVKDSQI